MWVIQVEDNLTNEVMVLDVGVKNRASCAPVMEHFINTWASDAKLKGEEYTIEGCCEEGHDHLPGTRLVHKATGEVVLELSAYQITAFVEAERVDAAKMALLTLLAAMHRSDEETEESEDSPPNGQSIH